MLSNIRVDIVLFVIIGMAMCTQSGIGRVAATGQWSLPGKYLKPEWASVFQSLHPARNPWWVMTKRKAKS